MPLPRLDSFRAVLLVVLLLLSSSHAWASPVKILFDTDMDSDCDDVGALAVLHALADRGEAEIVATTASSKNPWSVVCVDAINTFYGRPNIPIGSPKGNAPGRPSKYARQIAERFLHHAGSSADAPDAVKIWREILSNQPDQSVVLVTVGYLNNVADLLRLPASDGAPSGLDLARRKVRLWVCMGGNFVGRPPHDDLKLSNNNFTTDKASALYAIEHWPAPIVFVGREIGSVPSGLKVGAGLKKLPESNPVRTAYQFYFGGDQPKDRHVADPTTLLFAVRGVGDFWTLSAPGTMDLKADMTFTWREDPAGKETYLLKRLDKDGKPSDHQVERAIEELMLQSPAHSNSRQ
jgi:hypothetical protein